jgi:hypothetical protein
LTSPVFVREINLAFMTNRKSYLIIFSLLAVFWGISIACINPEGEFNINDDWAFQKALESFISEGTIRSTGWGPNWAPGGPSLLFHLVWGRLFTDIFGFSRTALRVSVLTLGVLGSFALTVILLRMSLPIWVAIIGAFCIAANPLYLSQSFTYMSDITFSALLIFSLLGIQVGIDKNKRSFLIIGLIFCAAATLTRQVGLVIAFGLICASLAGKLPGFRRWEIAAYIATIVVIPWLGYELWLASLGGTPLTEHQIIHKIFSDPLKYPFPEYVGILARRLLTALLYVAFFLSPILLSFFSREMRWSRFKIVFCLITGAFVLVEIGLISGLLQLPKLFLRNVIYDFGIGPLLLKDTYVLEIPRGPALPGAFYYLFVYVATVSLLVFASNLFRTLRDIANKQCRPFSLLALSAGMAYLGLITLTGFHDRYLIPLFILFLVWLAHRINEAELRPWLFAPGVVILAIMAIFSVFGTHDFMSAKRAQQSALDYIVNVLKSGPCDVDGGFEFNGYHCYDPKYVARDGLSWWWMNKENYVVTLGPLDNYTKIAEFPFERYLAGPGKVWILKPAEN